MVKAKNKKNHLRSIRIVIGTLGLGGAENHLCYILPCLVEMGWSVHVIVLSEEAPLASKLERAGVKVSVFPFSFKRPLSYGVRFLRITINLMRLWWSFVSDRRSLTHFFLPEAYVMGAAAKMLAFNSSSAVMSRRSLNDYQEKYIFIAFLEKFFFKRMRFILGNSQAVIKQLREEGVENDKLKLIYNGIDLSPFKAPQSASELRISLGLNPKKLLFVIVANLIPYKGHADLIEALALADLKISWQLLIIGKDNGIQHKLENLATQKGINQHIMWLGQIVNPYTYLMASDIGLLVSHQEGFSNAILECMAAGLPMIVTDVGGNREAVTNKCGLIIPSRNPQELSLAIKHLASNEKLRKIMGKKSQDRVFTEFNLQRCVEQYNGLYRSLL